MIINGSPSFVGIWKFSSESVSPEKRKMPKNRKKMPLCQVCSLHIGIFSLSFEMQFRDYLKKKQGCDKLILFSCSPCTSYHTAMIMTVGAVPLWLPASEAGMSVFLRHLTAGTGQPRGDCPYGFLPVRIIAVGYSWKSHKGFLRNTIPEKCRVDGAQHNPPLPVRIFMSGYVIYLSFPK